MTSLYMSLIYWFRDSPTIFGMKVEDKYCVNPSCARPELFAFQVVSGFALTTCGVLGFYTWHVSKRSHTALPNNAAGRIFGHLPEAELLAALNFMFQVWDFVISISIPEHSSFLMLSHHLMASTVGWCSLRYHYLHYYGVFFLGLTEVSSFFLVFIDLGTYFPAVEGSQFKLWVDLVCGPFFAVTFFYYRIFLWWPESLRLLRDVKQVVGSGQADRLRTGSNWVLYLFLCLNLPLGVLQLYWSTIIAAEARAFIFG
jgi:hypothetical protein